LVPVHGSQEERMIELITGWILEVFLAIAPKRQGCILGKVVFRGKTRGFLVVFFPNFRKFLFFSSPTYDLRPTTYRVFAPPLSTKAFALPIRPFALSSRPSALPNPPFALPIGAIALPRERNRSLHRSKHSLRKPILSLPKPQSLSISMLFALDLRGNRS